MLKIMTGNVFDAAERCKVKKRVLADLKSMQSKTLQKFEDEYVCVSLVFVSVVVSEEIKEEKRKT